MKLFVGIKSSRLPLVLLAGMACLLATGCKTYEQKNKVIGYWQQGNLPAAISEAKSQVDDNTDNKDTIIWELEQGGRLARRRPVRRQQRRF